MPLELDVNIEKDLSEYTEKGEHIYLLVEGAGSKPVARERLFYDSDHLPFIPIYVNTEYEPILRSSPLLAMPEGQNDFVDWFIEEGPEFNSGIVLVSKHNERTVLQHLQSMIEVSMPDYNFAAFRYHSPTVLDRYLMCVEDKDQDRILGPLSSMYWPKRLPDKTCQWRALRSIKQMPDEENPYLKPQPPIQMTELHLQAFEQHRYEDLAARVLAMSMA